MAHHRRIAVVGLGYVGLPVAAAFSRSGARVVAFDISSSRIQELRAGYDRTKELTAADLAREELYLTDNSDDLRAADFFIITVPTPIDDARRPDLRFLLSASRTVGKRLKRGDIVVYESTVYPGATEEECVPVLEQSSGLASGTDFTVGYSPERINPGDKDHRFETIRKVVAGQDYYLTHRAERSGYHPEVILAGRRMNDAMGARIAHQCVRMIMKGNGRSSSEACVTVLGLTFKENVPDIRNSKVVDIVRELQGFGIPVQAHDPVADPKDAQSEYGISLVSRDALQPAHAVILAVPHRCFVDEGWSLVTSLLKNAKGAVLDVKAKLPRGHRPAGVDLWRL
jgi:UDP-N-acetyl-D-mannosaminuronate dehydrogenase